MGASDGESSEDVNFGSFVDFNSRVILSGESDEDSRFSSSVFFTNTHSEHKLKLKDVDFVYSSEDLNESSFDVKVSVDDKKVGPDESIEVVVSSFIPSDLDTIYYDDYEFTSDGFLVGRLVLNFDLKDDFVKVVSVYLSNENFFEFGNKSFISYDNGTTQSISDGSVVNVVPGTSFSATFDAVNSLSSSSLENITFGVHKSVLKRGFVSFDYDVVGSSLDSGQKGLFSLSGFVSGNVPNDVSSDLSFFVTGVDSSGVTYGDVIDITFVSERSEKSLLPSLNLSDSGYVCDDAHVLSASLINNGLSDLSNVILMLEIPGLDVVESVPVSSLNSGESFNHNFAVHVPFTSEGDYSARLSGFAGSELMGEYIFDFSVSCDDYNVFKDFSFGWTLLILGYIFVIGGFAFLLYSKGFFKNKKK